MKPKKLFRMQAKQKAKNAHDRIVLCVGGRILHTSKQTLCVDADSMLAAWVLRHLHRSSHGDEDFRCSNPIYTGQDLHHTINFDGNFDRRDLHLRSNSNGIGERQDRVGDGPEEWPILWIDRDARRFDHVLNYLRNGTIWLEDIASLRAVQEEAVYFGLSGLESLCEERIQAQENLKRQHSEELHQAIRDGITDFCRDHLPCSPPCSSGRKGEVFAILRGCRLGASDASNEPVFQMDEDF